MPTSLQGIVQKAESQKGYRFRNLYGMLDEDFLKQCWRDIRKDAAAGVDQVSAQVYAQHLDENIRSLVERLKQKRYRAKLVRRHYIPKGDGRSALWTSPPWKTSSCNWRWRVSSKPSTSRTSYAVAMGIVRMLEPWRRWTH